MAIKLAKKDKAYTVEHQGATFTGVPFGTTARKKLAEKHTTYRGGGRPETDNIEVLKERFVKTFRAWSGVVEEGDNGDLLEVDCTPERRKEFVENNFNDAVTVLNLLDEKAEKESRVDYENLGE
jgi:hypothetical protein